MKNSIQFAVILAALLLVSACAGSAVKPYEKYNLDDQLEPVSEILKYNLMDWDPVDNQSFVLQTSPSQFYLVIMVRPSDRLKYTETISITNTGAMVKPGYDKVTVYSSPYTETFVIYKIYKLKDRDQIKAIKERLTGK